MSAFFDELESQLVAATARQAQIPRLGGALSWRPRWRSSRRFLTVAASIAVVVVGIALATQLSKDDNGHRDAVAPADALTAARKRIAVFRRAKTPRDVIPLPKGSKDARADLAGAETRLVYAGGDRRPSVYLSLGRVVVCIWEVGGSVATVARSCSPIPDVLSGRTAPSLVTMRRGRKHARYTGLLLDGAKDAQEQRADGTTRPLPIRNNVVSLDVVNGPVRIGWTLANGTLSVHPRFDLNMPPRAQGKRDSGTRTTTTRTSGSR